MVQRERSHNDHVQEVVEISPGVYGESLGDDDEYSIMQEYEDAYDKDQYTGPHFREWDEWSE